MFNFRKPLKISKFSLLHRKWVRENFSFRHCFFILFTDSWVRVKKNKSLSDSNDHQFRILIKFSKWSGDNLKKFFIKFWLLNPYESSLGITCCSGLFFGYHTSNWLRDSSATNGTYDALEILTCEDFIGNFVPNFFQVHILISMFSYIIFQKIIDDPLLGDFDIGVNWTFYLAPAVQDPSCLIYQIWISISYAAIFWNQE